MDILEQYEKENPEVKIPEWQTSQDYSFLVRLVMRISGGRIQEEKQANYVLFVAVGIMFLVAILIFFVSGPSSEDKARFSTVCFPVPCSQ